MVHEKTIQKLELENIRERLLAFAGHPLSKKWILGETLAASYSMAEDRLFETASALELLREHPDAPAGSLPEMEGAMKKIATGYTLSTTDLLHLLALLNLSRKLLAYFKDGLENPVFNRLLLGISDLQLLRERIGKVIDETGLVRDNASETLNGIRKRLRAKSGEIKRTLDHLLKRSSLQPYLQDNVVVKRGDSYCLSVKKEFAYRIPGVAEDTSASGNTVFIEPLEVANIRGELNLLRREEQEEIEKILRDISSLAHVEKEGLESNYRSTGQYNYYLSKALYTRSIKGFVPRINDSGIIRLRNARHPLLQGAVVANDIVLGDGCNNLIISGPNTGGKTVLLKMVGLFALMVSLGLGLPAGEGSEMAWFNRVYADIGDEQSIENSLSTFSGHMYNIREMIEEADGGSLLLFDELGNGTDPKEGSSLAMAILEYINRKGCHSVTTTHYGELKVFAYNTPGFTNASMLFDVRTLEPSYKLVIGTPGASLGIEVARRCGLDESIIESARGKLDSSDLEVGQLIEALEGERSELTAKRLEATKLGAELRERQAELEKERQLLKERNDKQVSRNLDKSRELLEDARRESEEIIRELKELKLNNPEVANRIRKKLSDLEAGHGGQAPAAPRSGPRTLARGQQVRILSRHLEGEVLEADDRKEQALVKVGIMKISLPYSDLVLWKQEKQETYRIEKDVRKGHIPMELDLRGDTVDEALYKLEKYLDEAVLSRYPQVRIVHGIGTGALKKAVWEYLKTARFIKGYRYGDSSEGSIGATVVEL